MSGPTYADLIRVGSDNLREAGIDAPVREARRLMQLASRLSATELIAAEPEIADPDHRAAFNMVVRARKGRKPFAHISGWTDFFGLRLRSDGRALIPRADSETVAQLALDLIPGQVRWTLADLGTGSGALLAALLHNRRNCRGVALDADSAALHLAAENFAEIGVSRLVELVSDTWSDWTGWAECDLIISNPPYICSHLIATLEPEVRDHDPANALDGGADGLDAYREIIDLAARHVTPGTYLVFEIGYDQKAAVSDLLVRAGFSDLQHRRDLGGHDRAIAARKT